MRHYLWFLLLLGASCCANSFDNMATLRTQSVMILSHMSIDRSSALQNHTPTLPEAILFVSFSMPQSLLLSLADQAAQFDIPVVIKGLVNNDFKQTVATFSRLSHEAQKQHLNFKGVSIDPVWFSQFNITAVPALVVSERPARCLASSICANQPFDVVYGNAQLKKGLEIIADRGEEASSVARKILEQGHV